MSAVIQTSAYCKIFLHAAKYSSSAIGGYVIGTGNSDQINITDIVPICHNNPCGPMFEIAAEMVSSSSLFTTTSYHLNTHEIWTLYATSQTESLFAGTQSRVLGYYFAISRSLDDSAHRWLKMVKMEDAVVIAADSEISDVLYRRCSLPLSLVILLCHVRWIYMLEVIRNFECTCISCTSFSRTADIRISSHFPTSVQ